MNAFGCFGDALGRGVGLLTVPQILLDGANGVSQAPRLCGRVEPVLLLAAIAAFVVTLTSLRGARRLEPRRWSIVLAILAASYAPGFIHTFVWRADRPVGQGGFIRNVVDARSTYVNAMREVLAGVPETSCFISRFDAKCEPYSGIYLAAARDLLPRIHCIRRDASSVIIEIAACTPSGVRARIAP